MKLDVGTLNITIDACTIFFVWECCSRRCMVEANVYFN